MPNQPSPKKPPNPVPSRPAMQNYGILGPDEGSGLMAWERVDRQLAAARNYWICTSRPDGRPHAAPVWGVWLEGALYFGSAPTAVKARNLLANPAVVVHLESGDDAVILEGVAESLVAPEKAWFDRLADAYEAKYDYRPGYPAGPGEFFAVRPRVAFAWLETDFPGGATRWQF